MKTRIVSVAALVAALGLASAPIAFASDDPDEDKAAIIHELHEQLSAADAAVEAAYLADEDRRRALDENTRELSPGVYFASGNLPVVRIYAGADAASVQQAVIEDWPDALTLPSRYTADNLAALRSLVTTIPLTSDEVFGADYDAERDIFMIGGNVASDKVARALQGFEYAFIEAEASKR